MKKLLPAVFLSILLFAGCASTAKYAALPESVHNVKVTVVGKDVSKCEDENKWKLSQLSQLGKDRLYVQLFSSLSVSDVTRVQKDLTWMEENSDIRRVLVMINSPGGDAFSGLALSDLLRRYREKHGFQIDTHGSGIVASAAVPIFASGEHRTADAAAIFMVHEAALWKWPGRETASDIASQNTLMQLLREKYMAILVKGSHISKDEWLLMEAKTSWFSAEKALDIGLATEIE